MPDMRYAAGMDGGGTKTVLEARAPDGRVLLRERFGPLNLNSAAASHPGVSTGTAVATSPGCGTAV